MLSIEKAELPEFQELLEEAKNRISEYYPTWTNFNPADSGMAILELFAYMTEMQQFHAEQIGASHKIAFLHLLGLIPTGLQAARVYAEARGAGGPFYIPQGMKAATGGMIWESEWSVPIEPALQIEKTEFPLYPFGEFPAENSVYELCLSKNLEKGHSYTIYFDVAEPYPVKRNPMEGKEFLPLVHFALEYFDGRVYQTCRLLKDETFGLLQSGFVQFRLGSSMKKKDGKYVLRLCARGEYDTAPLLHQISFHMLPLVQKDTRVECRKYRLSLWKEDSYCLLVDAWNTVHGDSMAYRMEGEGLRRLRRFTTDVSNGMRYFIFAAEEFGIAEQAPLVCLRSVQEGYSPDLFSYEADGSPNQSFFLPDRNILGAEFALWIEEEKDYYVSWKRVIDFAAAGEGERCYVLEEERGLLRFGDGRRGRAPIGRIEITGYALCAGQSGNMQKKQILSYVHEMGHGYLYNPLPGRGGKNPESLEDCIHRYLEEKREVKRAVTAEDYEELIRQTPGLRIKRLKVFQGAGGDNCFEVAVQPYTNGNRILRKDYYQRNILAFMEKKKLLGTGLIIRKTEYIGITLQLEVMIKSRFPEAEGIIRKAIQEYFDTRMGFGERIVYSRLYAYIDSLAETAGIRELSIYTSGHGIMKEENGDIRFPPNRIAYLENLEIRYLRKN